MYTARLGPQLIFVVSDYRNHISKTVLTHLDHTNGEWHSIKLIILEIILLGLIAPLEGHFFICIVKRHLILAKYEVQMKMTLTLNKLDGILWMEIVNKNVKFIKNN